ncbi:MAG: phytoene desaturase family protein [Candidatus Nanopelagicales bacterium]|nr:phytoene desaturase family protein [Candidatus Nanopelagicales bacterium]
MAKVAVIGAGMGGLAVAARLATKGHAVTVYEQAAGPGGKNAGFHRDGFRFDLGPSTLTLPAVYRDLFLKTGRSLEESVDLVEVEPAFAYHFTDGTTVTVPGAGVGACAAAMQDALGGDAAHEWRALLKRAGDIWALTRKDILGRSLNGYRDLLPLARSASSLRTVAPWQTMRQLGTATLQDPRARMILDRYATYTGSDPRRCPAALVTIPFVEQTFGVWHIGGGLHVLAEALHTRCEQRGVEFRFGCRVDRITTNAEGVTGVDTATGHEAADLVVADADVRTVYSQMLDDPRAASPLRRLSRLDPSFSGFVVLLALRGTTAGIRHHNVWFPDDYDAEFDALFSKDPRPVPDPTIYACVPDDPLMRPEGHESWFILINAPTQQPPALDWAVEAQSYADHILDVLAARGVDVRDRLLWREVRTPVHLQDGTGSPGGSIYGLSSNGRTSTALRPSNRSPVPGLFLVGGSAHPGGGLPLVGMSAEIVADEIGRA